MNREELREALAEALYQHAPDAVTDLDLADALIDDGPVGDLLAENERLLAVCAERDHWVASNARQRDEAEAENERLKTGIRAAWNILTNTLAPDIEPTGSEGDR